MRIEKSHKEKLQEKREISYKKALKQKPASDLVWNDPDTLHNYEELSDYLNIGKDEILSKWKSIPYHTLRRVSLPGKGGKLQVDICKYFSRKEVDQWAKEIGFWKLKEIVVKNYKEPLRKIPKGKGFGYYGAISNTKDGDGIQCHICGKFFMHLSGHLFHKHKINTRKYKEKFKLALSTPLTCDNYREELKLKELERIKNMTPEEKAEYKKRSILGMEAKKRTHYHSVKISLETKNKRGVCPDQLIQKIRDCSQFLQKTPSKKEFITFCGNQRYTHKIYDTFGSYTKATEIAKLQPITKRKGLPFQRAWSEEELIEYLRIFYQQTGKSPTQTDWYSHDLPNYQTYIRVFGGIRKAREAAEIPHPEIDRKGKKYGRNAQ